MAHQEEECHQVWEEVVPLLEAWAEVVHHLAWAEEDLVVPVAPVVLVVLEDNTYCTTTGTVFEVAKLPGLESALSKRV